MGKAKVNAFENDPLFQGLLAEGLAIRERFSAEPVYANAGKGYPKCAGVDELAAIRNMAYA
jgi:hypothetical protein